MNVALDWMENSEIDVEDDLGIDDLKDGMVNIIFQIDLACVSHMLSHATWCFMCCMLCGVASGFIFIDLR